MKILTVVYDLDKGGTQRAAQNFCEAYQILGHDSQLVAVYEGGYREKELNALCIPVYLKLSVEFIQYLKDWRPDIVHLHSHALKKEEVYKLKKVCQNAKFIETNVFSCLSDYCEDIVEYSFQLSEWCRYLYVMRGGSNEKSVIIPNPVKTDHFNRVSHKERNIFREKYDIPKDAFLLGRIGQRHYAKWSHYLIDILKKFISEVNANTYLILVNAPEDLITYARRKNLTSNVVIIDAIFGDRELSTCYSSIDLFVHVSSQGESFGYALTESLLCETPVVVYNTPWADNSQSEVIGNNVGGYCANSAMELFYYVKILFYDISLRERLGKRGRKKVIDDYQYITVAQNILRLIVTGYHRNFVLNMPSLLASQNLRFPKNTLVRILLWAKLKNVKMQRVYNYLLRRLVNHEVYYSK